MPDLAKVIPMSRPSEPIKLIATMLKVADDMGEVAEDVEDPTELALLREGIAEVRRVLALSDDELAKRMAGAMVEKRLETPFGVFERVKNIKRSQWDPELKERALCDVLINEGLAEPDKARMVARSLIESIPFSLNPRVTALRELGYDPSEWCHEEDNGFTIKATTDSTRVRKALPKKRSRAKK